MVANELTGASPAEVRGWLAKNHPRQLADLDRFEIELRLGRLSTSSTAAAREYQQNNGDHTSSLSNVGVAKGVAKGGDRRLVTSRTVDLLRSIVGCTKWNTPAQLLLLLKGLGKELHAVGGFREPAIGNVVRRVMCAVREETASHNNQTNSNKQPQQQSMTLSSMLWVLPQHTNLKSSKHLVKRKLRSESMSSVGSDNTTDTDDNLPQIFHTSKPELRPAVMEAIQEVRDELEDLHKNINEKAPDHIHADEVILTYARSKTVELFLKEAANKKRNFQVVICEAAPHFGGHMMAKSLAKAGIDTTVINDSAVFAIMARVNKVILPAHAVLANGGLVASSGSNLLALAAKENHVPVISITGMFKLCPQFPHEGQATLNDFVSPSSVIGLEDLNEHLSNVEYINPVHDYIPPQLISLYVTNIGCFQPSYIYKLLSEYYHIDDWDSFE